MVTRSSERLEVAPDASGGVRPRHHHVGAVRSWDTTNPPRRDGIGSCRVALACRPTLLAANRPLGGRRALPRMGIAHSAELDPAARSGFFNGLLDQIAAFGVIRKEQRSV